MEKFGELETFVELNDERGSIIYYKDINGEWKSKPWLKILNSINLMYIVGKYEISISTPGRLRLLSIDNNTSKIYRESLKEIGNNIPVINSFGTQIFYFDKRDYPVIFGVEQNKILFKGNYKMPFNPNPSYLGNRILILTNEDVVIYDTINDILSNEIASFPSNSFRKIDDKYILLYSRSLATLLVIDLSGFPRIRTIVVPNSEDFSNYEIEKINEETYVIDAVNRYRRTNIRYWRLYFINNEIHIQRINKFISSSYPFTYHVENIVEVEPLSPQRQKIKILGVKILSKYINISDDLLNVVMKYIL